MERKSQKNLSCRVFHKGSSWCPSLKLDSSDSLSIRPDQSLPMVSPLNSVQCPPRVHICNFLLIYQHRCVHVLESIGEYRLCVDPYFTSSVLHARLTWLVCEMGVCWGLQIRPVEEQLKQRVIGERYCISRKKRSHTKEVLAVRGLQSVCQMSRKKREVVFRERTSSENMFRLDKSIFGVW